MVVEKEGNWQALIPQPVDDAGSTPSFDSSCMQIYRRIKRLNFSLLQPSWQVDARGATTQPVPGSMQPCIPCS
ncbi:MAG: hypothetical protein ACTSUE_11585 [Promethearchaeota archaeon]